MQGQEAENKDPLVKEFDSDGKDGKAIVFEKIRVSLYGGDSRISL